MNNTTNAGQGGRELPTLFSLLGEIEGELATLDRLKSLMQIYEEHEETELSGLKEERRDLRGAVGCYLARRELSEHLYSEVTFQFNDCLRRLHELADTCYEIEKAGRKK